MPGFRWPNFVWREMRRRCEGGNCNSTVERDMWTTCGGSGWHNSRLSNASREREAEVVLTRERHVEAVDSTAHTHRTRKANDRRRRRHPHQSWCTVASITTSATPELAPCPSRFKPTNTSSHLLVTISTALMHKHILRVRCRFDDLSSDRDVTFVLSPELTPVIQYYLPLYTKPNARIT